MCWCASDGARLFKVLLVIKIRAGHRASDEGGGGIGMIRAAEATRGESMRGSYPSHWGIGGSGDLPRKKIENHSAGEAFLSLFGQNIRF